MAKAYPLEIENVGGDVYVLLSRGHHDIHEFMSKVREEGYDWPLGFPKLRIPVRRRIDHGSLR